MPFVARKTNEAPVVRPNSLTIIEGNVCAVDMTGRIVIMRHVFAKKQKFTATPSQLFGRGPARRREALRPQV